MFAHAILLRPSQRPSTQPSKTVWAPTGQRTPLCCGTSEPRDRLGHKLRVEGTGGGSSLGKGVLPLSSLPSKISSISKVWERRYSCLPGTPVRGTPYTPSPGASDTSLFSPGNAPRPCLLLGRLMSYYGCESQLQQPAAVDAQEAIPTARSYNSRQMLPDRGHW